MNKRLLLAFSPLLLLIALPFDIPLSVFFHTLAPYGSANPYILTAACLGTGILLFDYQLTHPIPQLPTDWFFVAGIFLGSVLLRSVFFPFESDDYREALEKWFYYIQERGGFVALKDRDFSDYNSLYLYIMAGLTYLPLQPLISIKLVSVFFDYIGAFWVYKLVRLQYPKGRAPLWAATFVLFAPTVVINSSMWAQCDMMYTSFLLMALYFLLKSPTLSAGNYSTFLSFKNPFFLSLIAFGFAFLIKLQSVFFVLPFLWLYLSKKIRLIHFAIVPLVLLLALVPHWLLGRNLADLLLIYPRLVFRYGYALTLQAPSVYQWFPEAPLEIFKSAGVLFTAMVVFAIGWYLMLRRPPLSRERLLLLATLSVVLIPFLLPKMHERYFFPADVLTILVAFYFPKRFWLPVVMGAASLFSYAPYLFKTEPIVPFPLLSLGVAWVAWQLWTDFRYHPHHQKNTAA